MMVHRGREWVVSPEPVTKTVVQMENGIGHVVYVIKPEVIDWLKERFTYSEYKAYVMGTRGYFWFSSEAALIEFKMRWG